MEELLTPPPTKPELHPEHGKYRLLSGLVALVAVSLLLAALWYYYGDSLVFRQGTSMTSENDALLSTPPPLPDALPPLPSENGESEEVEESFSPGNPY